MPSFPNCRASSQGCNQAIWKSLPPPRLQPHKPPVPEQVFWPPSSSGARPSEPSPHCGPCWPLRQTCCCSHGSARPFPRVSVLIHLSLTSRLATWDRATPKAPAAWGLRGCGTGGAAWPCSQGRCGAHSHCRTWAEGSGCHRDDSERTQPHSAAWALTAHDLVSQG